MRYPGVGLYHIDSGGCHLPGITPYKRFVISAFIKGRLYVGGSS